MRFWIITLMLIALPLGASAAGIVPCKGTACQACDLVKLGNNIISFLIGLGVLVAVVMVAWAGVKLVTSGGSSESVGKAKGMIWSALVGFVIILACYLLVDVFMKTLTKDESGKSMGVAEWTAKFCEAPASTNAGFGGSH